MADGESEKEHLIEAWKQSIDVQKHFNELSLQIRNTSITVLGAGLAATGFLVNENYSLAVSLIFVPILIAFAYAIITTAFPQILFLDYTFFKRILYNRSKKKAILFNTLVVLISTSYFFYKLYDKGKVPPTFEVNLGGVCLFALAIVTCIFYLLDRYWYHKLLKGAVNHAISVETKLDHLGIKHLDIGKFISEASPVTIGIAKLNSNNKLDLVYIPIIIALFFLSSILAFYGSSVVGKKPIEVAELNAEISGLKKEIKIIIAENKVSELTLKSRIDSVIAISDSLKYVLTKHRYIHPMNAEDSIKNIIPSTMGKMN